MKSLISKKTIYTVLEVLGKNFSFSIHLSHKKLKTEIYKGNGGKATFIVFALLKHSKI